MTDSPGSRVPPPEGGRGFSAPSVGPDVDGGTAQRGTVYLSKHAIRSLIRSETETSPIMSRPAEPIPARDATQDQAAAQEKVEVPAAAATAVAEKPKPPRVRRKGRVFLPVLVAAVTGAVVATGYLAVRAPHPPNDLGRWAATSAGSASAPGSVATGIPNPFGSPAAELHGLPTRLKVTAIGVDTPLETLHLGKNGELDPPADFAKAGWYAAGTVPGDLGPAVIAGHVDNKRGPAVFYRLRELEAGDRIEVVRGDTTVRFTVTSTAWYPKTAFPTTKVYGPTPDSQLRLITCGGVFDHRLRSYKDNLVVYAVAG